MANPARFPASQRAGRTKPPCAPPLRAQHTVLTLLDQSYAHYSCAPATLITQAPGSESSSATRTRTHAHAQRQRLHSPIAARLVPANKRLPPLRSTAPGPSPKPCELPPTVQVLSLAQGHAPPHRPVTQRHFHNLVGARYRSLVDPAVIILLGHTAGQAFHFITFPSSASPQ